jgi:hypothetical protein
MRWDNAGGARLGELHGVLVREAMVRRLKAQVMAQLPPKRRQVGAGGALWGVWRGRGLPVGAARGRARARASCAALAESGPGTRQEGPAHKAPPPNDLQLGWPVCPTHPQRHSTPPPSRATQVVRLPKPPPDRWPVDESGKREVPTGDSEDEEEGEEGKDVLVATGEPPTAAGGGSGGSGGGADAAAAADRGTAGAAAADEGKEGKEAPPKMTSAHKTALAKLPDVIDWLLSAMGVARDAGGAGGDENGRDGGSKGRPRRPRRQQQQREENGAAVATRDEVVSGAGADSSRKGDGGNGDSGSRTGGGGGGGGAVSGPKFLIFAHHR